MKRILLAIIFIFFLTGCSNDHVDNRVEIYMPNPTRTDIIKVKDSVSIDKFDIDRVNSIIKGEIKIDNAGAILPEGVSVVNIKNNAGVIELDLSESFKRLSKKDEILTKASIVNLFTTISDIYGVKFSINGKEYNNNGIKIYTEKNFLIGNDSEKREKKTDVILYFIDKDENKLIKNISNISYNINETVELNVIRELIRGYTISGKERFKTPLPKDTIVYSAVTDKGICHVKMNSELSKLPYDKLELAVYAIVNSLSGVNGVEAVKIYSMNTPGIMKDGVNIYTKDLYKNEDEELVVIPKRN